MTSSDHSSTDVGYRTRQSLIWYTTVPFLAHLFRFANSILLARLLVPSDFGIIGIITVILYYCDSFSDFGFGKAIVQREDISDQHYVSYFSFNLLVSMLFLLGAQSFADWLAGYYQIPELEDAVRVFAFLFLITALGAGAKAKLRRELNFKSLAIIDGLKVVVAMATSLTLALNGCGFWSIIYAMLVSHFVALVLLLYTSKLIPQFSFNLAPLRDLFHFGLWDFIGAQFKLIGDNADKLIIGKVLGAGALGYYDKAFGFARMPNDQISMRLSHISFSSFSRIQDDRFELEHYFFRIVILNAAILLPILVGLIWVSESFTVVFLGEKWLPLVPSLQILAVSFIFVGFVNPIVAMNQASAHVKSQTLIRIILTTGLVIGLVRAAPYGIEYAASMILTFNILMFTASYALLNFHLKLGWMKLCTTLLPPLFIAFCMSAALYAFFVVTGFDHGVWYLILAVIIGGLSYSLLFLLLPFSKLAFLRNRILRQLRLGVQTTRSGV